MSILDKSSLVMIPSGYKEDKLYSVKPRNGEGDFTFTRASTGTRVNADGYIEEVPWNLASYSEDYSSGSWVATRLSVTTDDTTSPRGDTTADKITTNTSGIENRIRNSSFYQTPNTEHTFSAYAKKGNVNWFLLRNIAYGDLGAGRVWFDLENGVIGTVNTGFTASIEDVGNGWYRCSMTCTTTSNPLQIVDFSPATNDNDYQSDTIGEFCYVWGVQLVKGNSPKPYIKTTDRLDIPRLDYSGGSTNPTLLLEPQRTNLVDNGNTISNWTLQGVTRLLNQGTSPQNIQEATLISETNDNSNHLAFVPFYGLSSGSQYTYSGFVKQGTQRYAFFHLVLGSVRYGIIFDFVTKSVTDVEYSGTPINESYYFTEYNDGWFRLVISMQKIGSGTVAPVIGLSDSPTPTYNNFAQPIYQGNSSKNIYVWGFQLEQGSYSTSYIPTSGTSVTRVGDVCDDGGDATTFNDTEGCLFVEIAALADDLTSRVISLNDGSTSNRVIILYQTITSAIRVIVSSGGSIEFDSSTQNYDITNFNKIALKYKENDFALWINGTEVSTDTSGLTPIGLNNLEFNNANGTSNFYGKCKQLIYFNEALTDDELEALTTI